MLFIIHQFDGHDIGVHAEMLSIEKAGGGMFRFHGPHGMFLELPARKVDYVKLVEEAWPDRKPLDTGERPNPTTQARRRVPR